MRVPLRTITSKPAGSRPSYGECEVQYHCAQPDLDNGDACTTQHGCTEDRCAGRHWTNSVVREFNRSFKRASRCLLSFNNEARQLRAVM
jgi:hypothetical protein